MIFSLDANVLIDLINGRSDAVRARFDEASSSRLALRVSPVALQEVMYGALISKRPVHQTALIDELRAAFGVEALTVQDAERAARLRASRRQAGRPIHGPMRSSPVKLWNGAGLSLPPIRLISKLSTDCSSSIGERPCI